MLWRCSLSIPSSGTPAGSSPVSRRIEPSPSIVGDNPAPPTGVSGLPSSLPSAGRVIGGVARMVGLESGLANYRGQGLGCTATVLAGWDVRRGDSWPEVKAVASETNSAAEDIPRRS